MTTLDEPTTRAAAQETLAPPATSGSRAARMRLPKVNNALLEMAANHGVCVRPVSLRRTDMETGRTEVIDIPCGATFSDKCPACAARAQRLRTQQIIEGWHRTDEPFTIDPVSDDQETLLIQRAQLEFDRAATVLAPLPFDDKMAKLDEFDADIDALDAQIQVAGMRGRLDTGRNDDKDQGDKSSRKRSTRRREDAPPLPRRPIQPHTTGRSFEGRDGKAFQPSMFLTLTLPSYGRVWDDGTPVDPDRYDYRQAAWDAIHFPKLIDRFWQNLRRAEGWNIQYAGAVEPQRRLAPHAHFAVRGTIPRDTIRKAAAATYHQVWWPSTEQMIYTPEAPPLWDDDTSQYVDRADPSATIALPTFEQAMAALDQDPDAEPLHVLWFGNQIDAKGVLADTDQAARLVRYIAKYLTKQSADCHRPESVRQRQHQQRLWAQLRVTPCSPRCANWLLYGIQPKNAKPGLRPGSCKGKAHRLGTLGIGGRRVLISRQWSGKTLADHRADNHTWVRNLLGLTTTPDHGGDDTHPDTVDADETDNTLPTRYVWEMARRTDPDVGPLAGRLLTAIAARIQRRNAVRSALDRKAHQGDRQETVNHGNE